MDLAPELDQLGFGWNIEDNQIDSGKPNMELYVFRNENTSDYWDLGEIDSK